eukprot:638193-Rhodomonas_salina.8
MAGEWPAISNGNGTERRGGRSEVFTRRNGLEAVQVKTVWIEIALSVWAVPRSDTRSLARARNFNPARHHPNTPRKPGGVREGVARSNLEPQRQGRTRGWELRGLAFQGRKGGANNQ